MISISCVVRTLSEWKLTGIQYLDVLVIPQIKCSKYVRNAAWSLFLI